MVIDLNKVADEASVQLLPDLNEEPPNEQGDEIHHYLQEDQVRLKENEGHRLQEGQAHYVYEGEHRAAHSIDLNVAACEEQQEPDAVLVVEEDHKQHGDINFDGPHQHNVNLEASNHQQNGDISFGGPHDYGVFDLKLETSNHQDGDNNFDGPHDYGVCVLKLEASDHQQEMQQMINMIEHMHDYGVYTDALDITFDEEKLEDSNVEEDEHANETTAHKSRAHKSRNLTEVERQEIYAALLEIERSNRGRLKRNATDIVAQMFQVSKYQVQRVWRRVKQCRAQGIPVDVRSRKKNCGRKKIQVDLSDILSVPLHRWSSIRSLADAIGVNKSTLHRRFQEGLLPRYCMKKTSKRGCDGVFPC